MHRRDNARRHAVRVAAITLSGALALTACGGGGSADTAADPGSGTGTITVWAHQGQRSEDAALQAAVKSFNESQADITVELTLIPDNDYTQTITTTAASALPDVLEVDGPTIANFVYSQKLAPLAGLVSEETIGNATDAIKAQGTVGDELYALGVYDSGLGLYGNKALLDAAGVDYPTTLDDAWTAQEFTAVLETLAAEDPDGRPLDISENYGLATEWGAYGFSPIVWSAGGALLEDGSAVGVLDSPEVAGALETFQSWKPMIDANTDGNAFTDRRVALSWVGHWQFPAYSEALEDDLVVLPLPDFGNGPKSGQGSWAWGIGAGSKNGAAAGAFLDYLLNDTNVAALTAANGAPPATRTALAASELYGEDGPLRLFAEQLARPCGDTEITRECAAVTRPVTAGYPVVTSEFGKALDAVYSGEDPRTALARAARAIDRDFADNAGYQLP